MPDDIQLQILPGPQIALTSRGARVASVPALPLLLPAMPPGDAAALWQALPPPVQAALAALHDLQPDEPLPLWLEVQLPVAAAWP